MLRSVEPEWLDRADPSDRRAQRVRRELRLVNALMGNVGLMARALSPLLRDGARIADLGAGDGTFMLRVAERLQARNVELALVDRAAGVARQTLDRLQAMGWKATVHAADAKDWLRRAPFGFDAIVANLFLHHFPPAALQELLMLASERTRSFIGCEPRRSPFALAGSWALALVGCSRETRHDATVSVRAGFRAGELSQSWPAFAGWQLEERPGALFSHVFVARRV